MKMVPGLGAIGPFWQAALARAGAFRRRRYRRQRNTAFRRIYGHPIVDAVRGMTAARGVFIIRDVNSPMTAANPNRPP